MTLISSNPTPYATNAATHLHASRCELLLLPAALLSSRQHRRIAHVIGGTLDRPVTTSMSWGSWILHLAVDGGGSVPEVAPPAGVQLTEGWWPDPVGLRMRLWVDRGAPAWMIEPDRLGLRPIFTTEIGPDQHLS